MSLELTNPPTKQQKCLDLSLCIVCQSSSGKGIVQNPKPMSFQKLKLSAERRHDTRLCDRLKAATEENCTPLWHRSCFCNYANERNVSIAEKIAASKEDESHEKSACSSREIASTVTTRASIGWKTDMKKCIFCQKQTKKKKSKLYRICEETMAQKLLETCRREQDEIFTRLCMCNDVKDIFAADVLYHDACRREYFNQKGIFVSSDKKCDILMEAFEMLLKEVDEELKTTAFELAFLSRRLKDLISTSAGEEESLNIRVDNKVTKKLLVDHYGEQILFSHPQNKSKSSLVFRLDIPISDALERLRRMSERNVIKEAAQKLREEINQQEY